MIAQHGGDTGPACWTWISTNMLGGRDEQEILRDELNMMVFDGSESVLSFYSKFLIITSAIVPAIPPEQLCQMYAGRYPASEYMSILVAIDATIGHANFMNYARGVNNGIQTYHQRLNIQDRRGGGNQIHQLFQSGDALGSICLRMLCAAYHDAI